MLDEHLGYVADRVRLEHFKAAIARTLNPGDRVVDVGTGSGILALLCLQAGAARVVLIDSTAMLDVARDTLARTGMADRCEFIRASSYRTTLDAPADVVICDHVGHFGFDYDIAQTIRDARRRFLAPGGRVIPQRLRLEVGAVESAAARTKVDGWRDDRVPGEFHWLVQRAANRKHAIRFSPESLLGGPAELGTIHLRIDSAEYFRWTAELRIERDGVMHGLAGWFECELADGVWMTNSPLEDRAIDRSQAFLPIDESVPVRAGDAVKVTVMARPEDNLIAWIVELPAAGRRFSHSTWQGSLLARDGLLRAQPDRVPRLSREGAARAIVLGYCDGRRSVREIEQAVLMDHPDLFPSRGEIARFVAQVLGRDTN